MAQFLTPAWFEQVNAQALTVVADLSVVIDQHVGNSHYRVRVAGGRLSVGPIDPATPADAALTLDAETAAQLATGTLSATDAFLAGRVKLAGDVKALTAVLPALAALGPALAVVRDATTY